MAKMAYLSVECPACKPPRPPSPVCEYCGGESKCDAVRCGDCKRVVPVGDADMWCPCGGYWERPVPA